jgi:hypothetical protein
MLPERNYAGTFEAHITVNVANLTAREKFSYFCQTLGVKCILIELPQGMAKTQLMTASYHHGSLENVLVEVKGLGQKLIEADFAIARIKIEAMVHNYGVPVADDEAQGLPANNYFEFHVKITLPANENLSALSKYCAACDAHLSANALKQLVDGHQERFITMRSYGVGRRSANSRFDALLATLKAKGLKLSQPQREYTIYDSNINLDTGWFGMQNHEQHK